MACFPLSHRKAGRVVALFCCVLLLFGGCAPTEPYSDASSLSQKVVINEYPSHTLQELTQTADAIVYGPAGTNRLQIIIRQTTAQAITRATMLPSQPAAIHRTTSLPSRQNSPSRRTSTAGKTTWRQRQSGFRTL